MGSCFLTVKNNKTRSKREYIKMIKWIYIFIILLLSHNVYSQDVYGGLKKLSGVEIIYAGKFTQAGTSAPTVSDEYNPYGITATKFYDSTGSVRIQLGTFSSSVNVSSSNLHPLLQSNTRLKTTKAWAVSSGNIVTVYAFMKQGSSYTNNYSFTLFLYSIK
jgi:hypothetical protein